MPVIPGTPPVEITLRRSPRARRFSLRVSRLDGRVTLSMPARASEREALQFALAQEDWIRRALKSVPEVPPVAPGAWLPVEGVPRLITPAEGRSVRLEGESLAVPGHADQVPARLAAFLKVRARDRLAEASDRHAAVLGLGYRSITLRDTRSRWGSCTAEGGLMYNWRLIMAPLPVLDYVAAHEVAHLAEMNHSPAFWAVVARLYPGYQTPRRWLKTRGTELHAFRFGS